MRDIVPLKLDQWLRGGSRHTQTIPALARWIVGHVPDGRILDVGTGSGELLLRLRHEGVESGRLYGCDIEPGHAEVARRRTGLTTITTWNILSGNPYTWSTGDLFSAVVALNWLHEDWPANHAVAFPKSAPVKEEDRLPLTVEAILECLGPHGLLIWDWHSTPSEPFQDLLARRFSKELRRMEVLSFDGADYPIFVHERTNA